jgi:hypothetical protein
MPINSDPMTVGVFGKNLTAPQIPVATKKIPTVNVTGSNLGVLVMTVPFAYRK